MPEYDAQKYGRWQNIPDEAIEEFIATKWPNKEVPIRLMLDSGAFSAWKRNEKLDIGLYLETITYLGNLIHSYVNMDTIAGEFGGEKTESQLEEARVASLKAYKAMRRKGFEPMGVFHMGEPLSTIDEYMDAGCDYLGIAPRKDIMFRERMAWMKEVFFYLEKPKLAGLKTHGLGLSSLVGILGFPWFSYDSTTWSRAAAVSRVMVPVLVDGEPQYLQEPMYIMLPDDRPRLSRTSKHGMYDALGPMQKKMVDDFFETAGFSLKELKSFSEARRSINLYYFNRISAASAERAHKGEGKRRFVMSTGRSLFVSAMLRKDFHVTDRLLSYHEMSVAGIKEPRTPKQMRAWLVSYFMRETDPKEYGRFGRNRGKDIKRKVSLERVKSDDDNVKHSRKYLVRRYIVNLGKGAQFTVRDARKALPEVERESLSTALSDFCIKHKMLKLVGTRGSVHLYEVTGHLAQQTARTRFGTRIRHLNFLS